MWRKLQIYLVLFDENSKAVPETREVDKGRAALYIYIFLLQLIGHVCVLLRDNFGPGTEMTAQTEDFVTSIRMSQNYTNRFCFFFPLAFTFSQFD